MPCLCPSSVNVKVSEFLNHPSLDGLGSILLKPTRHEKSLLCSFCDPSMQFKLHCRFADVFMYSNYGGISCISIVNVEFSFVLDYT